MVSIPPPETIRIPTPRAICDGSGLIDAALGHPRVYLEVDGQTGFVDCGYCDRRFVLEGGVADRLNSAGQRPLGA